MAVGRGLHRADEGRSDLRLPVEEEVARPVGETAVCHQGASPDGGSNVKHKSIAVTPVIRTHFACPVSATRAPRSRPPCWT